MFLVASLVLAQVARPVPAPEPAPTKALVEVDLASQGLSESDLRRLHLDFAEHAGAEHAVVSLLADGRDRARLDELGIAYTVTQPDLAAFYASRLSQPTTALRTSGVGLALTPPFGSGSMGGFYTFSEVESVLDQISAAYPDLTTAKFSIGSTLEGRSIWALKVSDNPDVDENEPEVRFDAMHHAREPQSMQTTLWALLTLLESYGSDPLATYLVNERELWFLPVVNPDGYVFNQANQPGGGGLWRKNRRDNGNGTRGVDLNRNYSFQWGLDDLGSSPDSSTETYRGSAPTSEPEVAAMQAFLSSRDFAVAVSAHSFSNLWLEAWGYTDAPPANQSQYTEISELATEVNGYVHGPASTVLYFANGVTVDYDQGVHGTLSWTPEIGSSSDGFWPPQSRIVPLAQENEVGFLRTAWAAGAYLRALELAFVDVGDGDGHLEVGEQVSVIVSLRNSGLQATGPIDLALTTGGGLTNVVSAVARPSLAAFSSADNAAAPLSFTVDAVPAGSEIAVSVDFTYQGFTQTIETTVLVGRQVVLLTDDVEQDLGWTVGVPSDTATTGLWAFGDPVGTSSNGAASNPEDDVTVGGVNAFVTGNGSTTAGGDDVDDGTTTLITPALDLSGVSNARLSYHRWYSLLSVVDDAFEVSISDDDGATWTPVETVTQNENTWTERTLDVGAFVNLTSTVRLRFVAADDPNNSLVEAGVDELRVVTFSDPPLLNVYGSAAITTPLAIHVAGNPFESYFLYASRGTAQITLANIQGDLLLAPATLTSIRSGQVPASGLERWVPILPNEPGLVGATYYLQALTTGGGLKLSNRVVMTFE